MRTETRRDMVIINAYTFQYHIKCWDSVDTWTYTHRTWMIECFVKSFVKVQWQQQRQRQQLKEIKINKWKLLLYNTWPRQHKILLCMHVPCKIVDRSYSIAICWRVCMHNQRSILHCLLLLLMKWIQINTEHKHTVFFYFIFMQRKKREEELIMKKKGHSRCAYGTDNSVVFHLFRTLTGFLFCFCLDFFFEFQFYIRVKTHAKRKHTRLLDYSALIRLKWAHTHTQTVRLL